MLRLVAVLTVVATAACSADPPPPPLSAEESEIVTGAVSDTVEMLSEVNTTNLAVTAVGFRRIPCATVDSDDHTFVTITYACPWPFNVSGTVHFEKTAPDQLISITDLMINKVSIDSATTLVVPTDPTLPRTFDGALVVVGPRRELDSAVSASWVVSGRCVVLDAAGFVSVDTVDHSWTITGKRVCHRF